MAPPETFKYYAKAVGLPPEPPSRPKPLSWQEELHYYNRAGLEARADQALNLEAPGAAAALRAILASDDLPHGAVHFRRYLTAAIAAAEAGDAPNSSSLAAEPPRAEEWELELEASECPGHPGSLDYFARSVRVGVGAARAGNSAPLAALATHYAERLAGLPKTAAHVQAHLG